MNEHFYEPIVYLDDHSSVSNNGIADLWLDFRTQVDLESFLLNLLNFFGDYENYIRYRYEKTSYLHITNLHIDGRLIIGRYYALNTGLLRKARMYIEEETDIALMAFDCSQIPTITKDKLLMSHPPLDPLDIEGIKISSFKGLLPIYKPSGPIKLVVADVGQANLNLLYDGDSPFFVYDVGAPFGASASCINQIISKYIGSIQQPCTLVISHWDIDHYQCLRKMSESDISNKFLQVLCTDQCRTLTSQRILNKLYTSLSGMVFCISNPIRTGHPSYPAMIPLMSNGFLSFYIGEKSQNINMCGLNAFVRGSSFTVQFTGDCLMKQADDVLQKEYLGQTNPNNHILVVPHHGGKNSGSATPLTYNSGNRANCYASIVSVGKNNRYGHPYKSVMSCIANLFNYNIHLTSLSHDFICEI